MSAGPAFLGIGAIKSATTWCAETLATHPEIFIAHGKEINYFTSEFERGNAWYLEHFARVGHRVAGEFSVSYLSRSRVAAPRIAAFNPLIKLVAVLRDPVDRAFSEYRWKRQRGEADCSFMQAIDQYPGLVHNGKYFECLTPFLEHFPREQLFLLRQDDIRNNAVNVAQQLYSFLGIDEDFVPRNIDKTVGKTIESRSKTLERQRIAVHGWLKRHHLGRLITFYKQLRLSDLYRALNAKRVSIPVLTLEERNNLIEFFRDDLAALQKETGLQTDDWITRNLA
ncbi:MAG: sulfotransferase domain-containing protein [Gammaproteobacteria bacterium]